MHDPLTKAAVADRRQSDLFASPAIIAGHMRGPVYVAPYTARRHRRVAPPANGPALPPGRIITTSDAERLLPPSFAAAAEEMQQRLMPRHVIRLDAEDTTMRPAGFITSPRRDLEYGQENAVPAGGDGLPDFVITINVADHTGKLRPAADVVHTLLHEFGHAFQFTRFHQAPAETQAAIRAQWDAETHRRRTLLEGHDTADAASVRRWVSRGTTEAEMRPTLDANLKHHAPYYRRFEEWFAEKFAAWMTGREHDSPVARFFAAARVALLDAWRRALALLGMPTDLPGGAFERFLDESWTAGGRPMRKAIIFLKARIPGGATPGATQQGGLAPHTLQPRPRPQNASKPAPTRP